MFSGKYVHNIDAKGRVAVPRDFRDALGGPNQGRVFLTVGPDENRNYLDIYPADKWEGIVSDILENGFSDLDPTDANDAREAFLHTYVHPAHPGSLDSQGRILVPQQHREIAGLKKEVVFTGDVKKFRLWASDEWQRASDAAAANKKLIRAHAKRWL